KFAIDGETFVQPARDGALIEIATGFAMAGIIVTQSAVSGLSRPFVENDRLGAQHVGAIAAEPDHTRRSASGSVTQGDFRSVHVDEFWPRNAHVKSPQLSGVFWHVRKREKTRHVGRGP